MPDQVKYLAAATLQIIQELHSKNIIYRDLKTENLILQKHDASLKLVDFGFAKLLSPDSLRTYTRCGTPGYSAPEVLRQIDPTADAQTRRRQSLNSTGYSYPCDIWSWGVLLCELTGGFNPFGFETKEVM
jgi:serine/threonine protein kinase